MCYFAFIVEYLYLMKKQYRTQVMHRHKEITLSCEEQVLATLTPPLEVNTSSETFTVSNYENNFS